MSETTRTDGSPTVGEQPRRTWLASVLMGVGLLAAYGTLAGEAFAFLLPSSTRRTRRIFVGPVSSFPVDGVRTIQDLQGNDILVKRTAAGFQAFSSTCPHLGCKVHYEADEERFFCPCHNGVFNLDGVAIAGPPGDAGQRLNEAPLLVDEASGVVYLEVSAGRRRRRSRA